MPRPPSTSRRVEPWALAIASVLALGCRGEDLSNDCDYQGQVYFQTVEGEVTDLLSPVPDRGPYPVALQLTEEGINRLLGGAVADQDVPFAGTLPLGFATAEFEPTSDPVIELTDLPTCRRCILFNLQFNIDLYSGDNPISSGPGNVTLSIPLRLESDEAAGESTLLADYSQAKIESMFLFVYGIDSNEHEVLAGALAVLLTEQIQEQFDTVELLKIGSWQIGEGDVTLLARELFVLPEDDKLVLGMQTNLPLPADAGLDMAGPLPAGIPMAVSMDTKLFLTMSHRMFDEGKIPRRYDDNGNPDPDGLYGVTLSSMTGSETGSPKLDTTFRVWRTTDGYCGFAEALMPLNVTVNNTATGIDITPGDATVVDGEGYGVGALQDPQLVEDNQGLVKNFRDSLADAVGTTINYDALDLEGSTIIFAVREVAVDTASINSYLDFAVYADE
ncbi:MAG: hypothetical protein KC501_05270 [Myxococcales bacterium]|nr:hypothetical protein [Myxococcales bacterium]